MTIPWALEIATVLAVAAFTVVVFWVYSPSRRAGYEQAAQLPLEPPAASAL